MEQFEAQMRADRKRKLIEKGLYDEDEEKAKEERRKLFDNVKYPEDINVAIDLIPDTEKLINELQKVECKAGNDDPEDWVGALDIALNDISWRENSKKNYNLDIRRKCAWTEILRFQKSSRRRKKTRAACQTNGKIKYLFYWN